MDFMHRANRLLPLWIAVGILFWCHLAEAGDNDLFSKGQNVYVPAYSHIYCGDREFEFLLAVTLSIRNTDFDHSITILSADYYDSDGKIIRRYVETPFRLKPMASMRFVVQESDKKGGSGANFVVRWESTEKVNIPLIESVMIGTRSQQGISFTSRGQVIAEHTKQ